MDMDLERSIWGLGGGHTAGNIRRICWSDRPERWSMGVISQDSIQWEFETTRRQAVADGLGIWGFFSGLEEPSTLKCLIHSVVAADSAEAGLWNRNYRYARTLVGNLPVAASLGCAPAVLHDFRILLSSSENQLKAVKAYNVEERTNQVSHQVHSQSDRWLFPATTTRLEPYDTRFKFLWFSTRGEAILWPVLSFAWLAILADW